VSDSRASLGGAGGGSVYILWVLYDKFLDRRGTTWETAEEGRGPVGGMIYMPTC